MGRTSDARQCPQRTHLGRILLGVALAGLQVRALQSFSGIRVARLMPTSEDINHSKGPSIIQEDLSQIMALGRLDDLHKRDYFKFVPL